MNAQDTAQQPSVGAMQLAIIGLGLISALIHASFLLREEPLWVYLSFALVAVAYPAGLAGLYWQRVPVGLRKLARFLLIAITVSVIVGYLYVGFTFDEFTGLGNVSLAAEVVLLVLLLLDARRQAA
ncbi:MAG: hypothetical protein H0V93_15175 [Euzebyales bacterium]|nr:hypothetical protein [Euzebyales bacterium]